MSELIRFGDSMDGCLLARFDQLIDEKGDFKPVRGIKDLIRDEVVEHFFTESLM
jgi:metal-responsive CopG/Arc/MetJ family transcriptional regulator